MNIDTCIERKLTCTGTQRVDIFENPTARFLACLILPLLLGWGDNLHARDRFWMSIGHSVHGDTLSVHLEQVPLMRVLEELGRQTDIKIVDTDNVASNEIEEDFQDVPLNEGIKRLLSGHSYFLISAEISSNKNPFMPTLQEIRLLKTGPEKMGSEQGMASPHVASQDGSKKRARKDDRAQVIALLEEIQMAVQEEIPQHDKERIREILTMAIKDEDEVVRKSALNAIEGMQGDISIELLREMALKDSSPELRGEALNVIIMKESEKESETILMAALEAFKESNSTRSGMCQERENPTNK